LHYFIGKSIILAAKQLLAQTLLQISAAMGPTGYDNATCIILKSGIEKPEFRLQQVDVMPLVVNAGCASPGLGHSAAVSLGGEFSPQHEDLRAALLVGYERDVGNVCISKRVDLRYPFTVIIRAVFLQCR